MAKFIKKLPEIEGIQFTGGLESAQNVIEWLYVRGFQNASYGPEILNDGTIVRPEQVLLNVSDRPNVFLRAVYVNQWLMLDLEADPFVCSDETVKIYYDQVSG